MREEDVVVVGGWRGGRVCVWGRGGLQYATQLTAVAVQVCMRVLLCRCLLEEKKNATETLTSIILLLSNHRLPGRKEK